MQIGPDGRHSRTESIQFFGACPARRVDRSRVGAGALYSACRGVRHKLIGRCDGITTLVRRVREELDAFGMNTVNVNLFGLLSVEEAADRIEEAYRRSLQGT